MVAGGLGIASRVRNRHASLSEQMRSPSGSPATTTTTTSPSAYPPIRRSSSSNAPSSPQYQQQQPDTLAGTKKDPLGSTTSTLGGTLSGTTNKVRGLLTQLPELSTNNGNGGTSATSNNNNNNNNGSALSSPITSFRGTANNSNNGSSSTSLAKRDAGGLNSTFSGTLSKIDPTGFEAQLIAWRKQPKNLSPAAGLRLPAMLPPPLPTKKSRVLLCLDIDETLVHASFTPAKPYNVKITIDVDGERGDIFVAYRPHVHEFLSVVGSLFEIAIFTASQSCYANPLMDALDPDGVLGRNRMFRQHCTEVNGARVKDMSLLGRSLDRVCLLDNSPVAYLFQPRNSIPIVSWFDDPNDTELLKLLPMLRELAEAESVYDVLDPFNCTRGSH